MKSREAVAACLGFMALLMAAGTACSPEPLSVPTAMDFSGEWILSDSVSGLVVNELPPPVCKTADRALHIERYADNSYAAQEQYGGTYSCLSDGVFSDPYPLSGSSRAFFQDVGPDSTILSPRPGGYQEVSIRYRATVISPDRLAGAVYLPILGRPDDGLPHGTWEMIRTY